MCTQCAATINSQTEISSGVKFTIWEEPPDSEQLYASTAPLTQDQISGDADSDGQDKAATNDTPSAEDKDSPVTNTGEPADPLASRLFARLGRLWRDEHLHLRESLWPVPTRLARLAAKRAMLHIKNDNAQQDALKNAKSSSGADLTEFLTKAVTLPKLNPELEKTLYYL